MPQIHDRTNWLLGDQFHCLASPRGAERAWRLILIGAPGVGKGTQARLLADALALCVLSTGDLFRDLASRAATLGSAAALAIERMRTGQLVPDDLVISLVRNRRRCFHCPSGFILDGFPRTVVQAAAFDGLLAAEHLSIDLVIHYTLPEPGLVARVLGRRVCPRCGALYNTLTQPPAQAGCCDRCGDKLIRRADDEPVARPPQLEAHAAAVASVADHYRRQGLLVEIDADAPPERVFARTLNRLATHDLVPATK